MGKKFKPGKQPRAAAAVSSSKEPRTASFPFSPKTPSAIDPRSSGDLSPSWKVAGLQLVSPYGWHELDGKKLLQIHERLRNFESMTWNAILVGARKQHHSIALNLLCKEARADLDRRRLILEKVVSLRLTGEERIWGYLTEGVLSLLWWDPDHEICPSIGSNN